MSRLRAAHDPYTVDGGCTCPGTRTLFQLRIEGHTAACTEQRRRKAEEARRLKDDLRRVVPARSPGDELQRRRDVG